jgi:hypothetical protein
MARLSLSEWASIAEVVGAVAVVISLVYVGVQIGENTIEVRESNRQQLVNRSISATAGVAASPELVGVITKVGEGSELSPGEASQYAYFVRGLLYDVQEAYLLNREGRLSDEYWETRDAIFVAYMKFAPALDVYHRDRDLGVLHPDFVSWADQTLAEGPGG